MKEAVAGAKNGGDLQRPPLPLLHQKLFPPLLSFCSRSDIAGTKVMMTSQMNSKVFSDLNFCEFIFSNPLKKNQKTSSLKSCVITVRHKLG